MTIVTIVTIESIDIIETIVEIADAKQKNSPSLMVRERGETFYFI